MHVLLRLSASVLALSISGCVIPLGSRVSSGQKFSAEALSILDKPGTTRDNVIAYLGEPLLESHDTRTLVYVWYKTPKFLYALPDELGPSEVVDGTPQEWGLFIAYDERGIISAHEVRKIDNQTLEEACSVWYRSRHNKP